MSARSRQLLVVLAALGVAIVSLSHARGDLVPARPSIRSDPRVSVRMATVPLPGDSRYELRRWILSVARHRFRISDRGSVHRDMARELEQSRAFLVFNGGFFGLDGAAQGLAISNGRTLSELDRRLGGGVFSIEGTRASLFAAETYDANRRPTFAIQCRPRLIVRSQVNIRTDDGKRAERTALCIRENGEAVDLFVTRTQSMDGMSGPTLREFARQLAHRGCEEAINLDGGPSSGVAWHESGRVRELPPRVAIRQFVTVTLR